MSFVTFRDNCPYLRRPRLEPRRSNAFNIEIGAPALRCILKPPASWPEGMVLRWIGSGGSLLVFGKCTAGDCALGQQWCPKCGHRMEFHGMKLGMDCCVLGCSCDGPECDIENRGR